MTCEKHRYIVKHYPKKTVFVTLKCVKCSNILNTTIYQLKEDIKNHEFITDDSESV